MRKNYQITRAAEFESLALLRDFIDRACRESGIPEEKCFDLQLSMDEACSNIIQHGYAGMNPGSIILEIEIGDDSVTMFITDFGLAFEPRPAPKPDVAAALAGAPMEGFGLFLIYSMMDSVDYRSSETGNVLILKKFLK